MFTGIVEEIGTVQAVKKGPTSMQLTVACSRVLTDVKKGDSISVNGVCLTVTDFSKGDFIADVMPETFKATTLFTLQAGNRVNLERAMAANGRFGGHFVTGHVDCIGEIIAVRPVANAIYFDIRMDSTFQTQLVPKGSITVDGTSLTVFAISKQGFTVSLIPVTQTDSILGNKRVGDYVNIECDILAKYMERIVSMKETEPSGGLTMATLAKNGFLD
ncbi:riboflavin synthase [Sporosarcina highlanderae]|uniref:Riboflavin synthase n=1 Tax=Sporosarcina highlanderae TaxID=3035916 RepID=A0ABT8JTV2_9BACL|nr:riboflavin synthase [Sporosarcina highlanderae]MDN4607604.1 riboflavin synthase [Sporosarcina highlanderae]